MLGFFAPLPDVTGNTTGLKPSHLRRLERLYRRRIARSEIVSPELATQLCEASFEIGRQVGVLASRSGDIEHVFVGDAQRLLLPDFGRLRAGRGRLRGLRLVHTHLHGEPLSRDDLTDLARLRLDLVAAIGLDRAGRPASLYAAHLSPDGQASAAPERAFTVLAPVPAMQPGIDFSALVEALESEFARVDRRLHVQPGATLGVVVHVALAGERDTDERIAELRELCRTAGVAVLDVIVQRRPKPDPKFLVGRGKLDEVVVRARQLGAELVVFSPDLAPAQARSVTDATDLKVIDRTMLILDIFAQRAKSRDGKIQVERAQLEYALPRLVEKNTMMSRLTGGIGGRGPGETKLEENRRRARSRIAWLERQIENLARQRQARRALRASRGVPVVSIVGYTNAGKSTLLNNLTHSEVLVEDRLFATLDPTTRRLRFPREREVIIADTVGFIRDLPVDLRAAFRATLEEIREADLLLHLVDASDPAYESHIAAVERILEELGLARTPRLVVFNKADRIGWDEATRRAASFRAIVVSALAVESTRPLLDAVARELWKDDRLPLPAALAPPAAGRA